MDKEVLKKLKRIIERDIEKLSSKSELTPAEHTALKDALINHAMIEEECQNSGYDEEASGYPHYQMRASYSRGMSYDDDYVGRHSRGMNSGYYGRGSRNYSGHSINDRIIDKLERMMDEADSEYERQTISKYIEKLEK